MKLPSALEQLLHGKQKAQAETFLSLILDPTYIMAAAWRAGPKGTPHVLHQVGKAVLEDTWELRTQAVDTAVVDLENILGTENINKVVLGVSDAYLSSSGEIESTVRPHIKKLMSALSLTALGFVPVHQALIYAFKQEEGVPPNAILIGVSDGTLSLYLYKIGLLVGSVSVKSDGSVSKNVEEALKSIPGVEVLPSRMLLYGGVAEKLEEVKRELLHHPWATRVSFLHFPKIEILPVEFPLQAVSVAGASELSRELVIAEEDEAHTAYSQPSHAVNEVFRESERGEETLAELVAKEGVGSGLASRSGQVPEEIILPTSEGGATHEEALKEEGEEEDANVVAVNPETLGFHAKAHGDFPKEERSEPSKNKSFAIPAFKLPSLPFSVPKLGVIIVIVFLLLIAGVGFLGATWVLPRASVTITTLPKTVDVSEKITIDPQAAGVDSASLTIPGRKQEKSLTGEKTITVTGKKKIGDPSKGTVTVYNKSLTTKNIKKGVGLSVGSLKFTLDADVQVASASESIGSITFGKGTANITALQIGSQGNLPVNTEFTFADISGSILIARNDQALTGGNSKDVTVVSRADYDSLAKSVSLELTAQAKKELAGSVEGGAKLIDDTIKTSITAKEFDQELDQQISELHGKVTVSIEGISYSDKDIATLFEEKSKQSVPPGYQIVTDKSEVSVSAVSVKKDGSIQATVRVATTALPSIDEAQIRKSIVGKNITQATEWLRNLSGVSAVSYDINWSLAKDRLPANPNNIKISVQTQ